MQKSYIWTLPTRVFHTLLALFVLLAFLTNQGSKLLNYHAIAGYVVGILLVFRFFWGYIGPKYSKFKDFPLRKKNIKEFISNIFDQNQKYSGHNPLASYVMIGMLVSLFLAFVSGILFFGIEDGKGILGFLNSEFFKKMKLFKEIHEIFANLFIGFLVLHLIGIFVDKLLHKKDENLNSIFTGYKNREEVEIIKLNIFQKLFSFLMFLVLLAFLTFNLYQPKNILTSSIYQPIDFKVENPSFVKECGSCHTLYPPSLLPAKSWEKMMQNLDNHFGDDASLDEETNKNILAYLVKNSAENSTTKASFKFLNSIKNEDIIAMSQTSFWKKVHNEIPKEVFNNPKIKSKANCKACHTDIEKGFIQSENIKDFDDIK